MNGKYKIQIETHKCRQLRKLNNGSSILLYLRIFTDGVPQHMEALGMRQLKERSKLRLRGKMCKSIIIIFFGGKLKPDYLGSFPARSLKANTGPVTRPHNIQITISAISKYCYSFLSFIQTFTHMYTYFPLRWMKLPSMSR